MLAQGFATRDRALVIHRNSLFLRAHQPRAPTSMMSRSTDDGRAKLRPIDGLTVAAIAVVALARLAVARRGTPAFLVASGSRGTV